MAISRLWGLSYVVGLGFLLLVSMVLSTAIQMITKWASDELQFIPLGPVMGLINESLSFGIAVLLFWGLMRMGRGIKPSTRYLLLGSLMGAALFTIGKQALAWYLSTAAVVSAYGAAGSLVVVLMWFYFTSAILLFAGACARAFGATNPPILGLPRQWKDPVERLWEQAQAAGGANGPAKALPPSAGDGI